MDRQRNLPRRTPGEDMPGYVVVGSQWGDEGKGKIVDLLTERVDIVARYGGGPNAGHTIRAGARRFALHHVPSGILRENVLCVIGNGMVIDPGSLIREIAELRAAEVRVEENLRISDRAHLILPYHRGCDIAREDLSGEVKIGTTRLGVGPAYEGNRVATICASPTSPTRTGCSPGSSAPRPCCAGRPRPPWPPSSTPIRAPRPRPSAAMPRRSLRSSPTPPAS
jgi:hypothetical protein